MATGNLFQGLGKGSIGDVVFYRNNGKQVSRVRNRQVKNPKTSAQMAQRTIMQNVSQAYSAMKEIVDHSRQGISYGAKTMAAFMKDNLNVARLAAASGGEIAASWVNRGTQVPPVLPLIMSRGTLEPQTGKYRINGEGEEEITSTALTSNFTFPIDEQSGSDLQVRADTFMKVAGLSKGDMLTFCMIVADKPFNFGEDNATLKTRFIFGRIKIRTSFEDEELSKPFLESGVIDYEGSNLVNQYSAGSTDLSLLQISQLKNPNGSVSLKVLPNFSDNNSHPVVLAACVIKSTKIGASYLRSSETLIVNDSVLPENVAFNSFEDALLSYQQKGESLGGSPYYLNGGNE